LLELIDCSSLVAEAIPKADRDKNAENDSVASLMTALGLVFLITSRHYEEEDHENEEHQIELHLVSLELLIRYLLF